MRGHHCLTPSCCSLCCPGTGSASTLLAAAFSPTKKPRIYRQHFAAAPIQSSPQGLGTLGSGHSIHFAPGKPRLSWGTRPAKATKVRDRVSGFGLSSWLLLLGLNALAHGGFSFGHLLRSSTKDTETPTRKTEPECSPPGGGPGLSVLPPGFPGVSWFGRLGGRSSGFGSLWWDGGWNWLLH